MNKTDNITTTKILGLLLGSENLEQKIMRRELKKQNYPNQKLSY